MVIKILGVVLVVMCPQIYAQTFPTPHNDVYSTNIEKYVGEDSIIGYYRNAILHSVVADPKSGVSHTYLLTVLKEKDYSLRRIQIAQGGLHALDTHYKSAIIVEILNRKTGLTLIRFSTPKYKAPPRLPILSDVLPDSGDVVEVCWYDIMNLDAEDSLNRTFAIVSSVNISKHTFVIATNSLGRWGYHGCAVYREGRLLGVVFGANPKGAGYVVQIITRNLSGIH